MSGNILVKKMENVDNSLSIEECVNFVKSKYKTYVMINIGNDVVVYNRKNRLLLEGNNYPF